MFLKLQNLLQTKKLNNVTFSLLVRHLAEKRISWWFLRWQILRSLALPGLFQTLICVSHMPMVMCSMIPTCRLKNFLTWQCLTTSTFSTMFFGTSSVSRKFVPGESVRSLPSAFGYGAARMHAKGGRTQDLLRSINFDVLSSIPPWSIPLSFENY